MTVTFQPGETQMSVDVVILNDAILEGIEMFTAELTTDNPNVTISSNSISTVLITDNDSMFYGDISVTHLLVFYDI